MLRWQAFALRPPPRSWTGAATKATLRFLCLPTNVFSSVSRRLWASSTAFGSPNKYTRFGQ
eukprot:4508683-Alexandrium_andersonii.AAC.1